jgi:hypothetical protein
MRRNARRLHREHMVENIELRWVPGRSRVPGIELAGIVAGKASSFVYTDLRGMGRVTDPEDFEVKGRYDIDTSKDEDEMDTSG